MTSFPEQFVEQQKAQMSALVVPERLTPEIIDRVYFHLQKKQDTPNALYEACLDVWPTSAIAYRMYVKLCNDPRLHKLQSEIVESGTIDYAPSKADWLREVWQVCMSRYPVAERNKAFKMYAEVAGFVSKEDSSGTTNNFNGGIMIVSKGNDDDWENGLANQQRRLMNGNAGSTVIDPA